MNVGLERFKGTNCTAYGKARDDHIVKLIKNGRAFTRSQVEQIIITSRKSSKRIAQRSLARLYDQGRIKKKVYGRQLPSVYYYYELKYKEHALLINDVYVALLAQKKPWYKIEWKWRYYILHGMVVADAIAFIYTERDKKGLIVVFVEVERNAAKRFDKDEKYQSIYDADWVNEEWVVVRNNTAIFPAILIVTDDKLVIKSELNFIVSSIGQVQKDVYSLLLRR